MRRCVVPPNTSNEGSSDNRFPWNQQQQRRSGGSGGIDETNAPACSPSSTSPPNEPCQSLCGQRARRMHGFYASQQLCDVCLRCGDKQIHAHRVVLAAACDYFDRMFNGSLKEASQRDIQIEGIEPDALAELLSYCYTGNVRLEKGNVESVLSGACFLRLDDVIERCTVYMRSQMDASNCLGIRSFADSRGCVKLHQSAHEYTTQHFMEVVRQPEYLSLPLDDVLALLVSDDLNVASEMDVFEAALEWINNNNYQEDRRQYASRLLSVVRLPCLSPEYLTDFVDTHPIFHDDSDCQLLLKEAMKYHLLPDRRAAMNLGDAARPRKSTVGTLYIIGGMDPNKGALTIERFDPLKNEWKEAGRMPARRLQFGVAVINGALHLVGGRDGLKTLNSFDCWEPTTNTWTQLPAINTPRHGLGVAVLEGVVYAIGGHDGWSYLSTAERYDPRTKTWTYIGEMSQARNTVGVAVLAGRIYAIGGRDSGQCLRTVEYYSPHTNKWTQCAQMAKRRGFVGVGVLNGFIYVVGGLDTPACYPTSTRLCCVERYDPKADSWTMVANLNLGRDGVAVCPVGNLLFAIGGFSGSTYLQLVECYDPVTNEWHEAGGLKIGRAAACVAVVPRNLDRTGSNNL